jgi:hypothetical protein
VSDRRREVGWSGERRSELATGLERNSGAAVRLDRVVRQDMALLTTNGTKDTKTVRAIRGLPDIRCALSVPFGRGPADEADSRAESPGNPRGRTFDLVGVLSIVERRGQRREPAAADVRLLSGRLGWLPFAGLDGSAGVSPNSLRSIS